MKRMARITCSLAAIALFAGSWTESALAAKPSPNRVVVMYFHRTQRCPTCLKMGGYSEEAVKAAFAKQLKEGTVAFHYVDFQNKKNAAISKGYRVTGPALIVAKIVDNKVAEYKNLKDIWKNVLDKKAFLKYVQDNVTKYRKSTRDKLAAKQDGS